MRIGLIALAAFLGLLMPSQALAYIIVLRNGSYVDVGEAYRLNGDRLEYRYADGSTRVIPVAQIDFPGTAMMNGEPTDEFVNRASRSLIRSELPSPPPPPVVTATTRPRRTEPEPALTITNATLEPYRAEREREEAEQLKRNPDAAWAAARRRPARKERVVPAGPSTREIDGWRAQADQLRDEIESQEAQIEAIREEIAIRQENPFDYRLSYEYNYGRSPVIGGRYGYYNPYGTSYSRADEEMSLLSSRLVDLEIRYQATLVRWNTFLERARRAGVPPGVVLDY